MSSTLNYNRKMKAGLLRISEPYLGFAYIVFTCNMLWDFGIQAKNGT